MNNLSQRLNRLQPSATLAMSQKSNEMKARGIDIINMSIGEPDFNTPEPIKEAAKKAIDDNYSHYSAIDFKSFNSHFSTSFLILFHLNFFDGSLNHFFSIKLIVFSS